MELRRLGQTDLHVTPIIFGAMERRPTHPKDRIKLIHAAIDRGVTTIDTAPLYGFGASEEQIGNALSGTSSGKVQVLTKVGLRWDTPHGRLHFQTTGPDGTRRFVRRNSRPDSVRWEVEQSLRRIRVDRLDLVQIHFPDVDTPISDTMGALLDLRRQGKLRYIGVSNFSPSELAAAQTALGATPLCCVQSKYNLLQRDIEYEVLPWCVKQDVGVAVYSPLAEGRLAAERLRADSIPRRVARAIRDTLIPFALDHGVPPAAVALRWLISRSGITAAIVGASLISQLDDHLLALELEASQAELDSLHEAFAGIRLPESWERNPARRIGRRFMEMIRRMSKR